MLEAVPRRPGRFNFAMRHSCHPELQRFHPGQNIRAAGPGNEILTIGAGGGQHSIVMRLDFSHAKMSERFG